MRRYLMILEVSQKQAYIFASRALKDNICRSDHISYATSSEYFSDCCYDCYSEKNLVYSGGGHTVLQFSTREQAVAFSRVLTRQAAADFPDMDIFVTIKEYDKNLTPGENLIALSAALEKKKAERSASFRRIRFGIESSENEPTIIDVPHELPGTPAGWTLTEDINEIANDDNFVAIVHIDGNGMGKRLQNIYNAGAKSWEDCVDILRRFSEDTKQHYSEAYDETSEELAAMLESDKKNDRISHILPMRKIIGAGDDVCFVCAGNLALECAASFLKNLQTKVNSADGKNYAACAGIVLVHTKYPFREAYDLSEELCSNAKKYGAELKDDGSVCAIDWHIEFGQLKDDLNEIRKDYIAEDGTNMTLRPLVVIGGEPPVERTYEFFTTLVNNFIENRTQLARSKVKALRTAFAQGRIETALAIRSNQIEDVLWYGLEKRFPNWLNTAVKEKNIEHSAYMTDADGIEHCLYFDAIESMDHVKLFGRAQQ